MAKSVDLWSSLVELDGSAALHVLLNFFHNHTSLPLGPILSSYSPTKVLHGRSHLDNCALIDVINKAGKQSFVAQKVFSKRVIAAQGTNYVKLTAP